VSASETGQEIRTEPYKVTNTVYRGDLKHCLITCDVLEIALQLLVVILKNSSNLCVFVDFLRPLFIL